MKNGMEKLTHQDFQGLIPRRNKAVRMGNQRTPARWSWEERSHRAAQSMQAEAEREDR